MTYKDNTTYTIMKIRPAYRKDRLQLKTTCSVAKFRDLVHLIRD